jgi:hypothetical protein
MSVKVAKGIEGAREGFETAGDFWLYGTKADLLNIAAQINEQASTIADVGWVQPDLAKTVAVTYSWKEK